MTLESPDVAIDAAARDALIDRLFDAGVATFDVLSVYLGDRLGLYDSLATGGPATPAELAERAGIHPRYAREWLEQQAATGLLDVDDPRAEQEQRRFSLSPAHAAVVAGPVTTASMAPFARSIVASALGLQQLLDAYRSGGGVEWPDYGADMVEAQGDFNRPWLLESFGARYLPSIPDIHARLLADPPARVADVACGVGWASIAIAKAYPKVRVDGFDLDEGSIVRARRNAADSGVKDRVTFEVRDGGDPASAGAYDLAVIIEALHDVSRPVEVLRAIRSMLTPSGAAIVADERTADVFTAPAEPGERLYYGYSITTCLPAAMADPQSAGTGTVMRTDTLRRYAAEAGFRAVEVLDIDHDMLRFYRLTP